MCRSVLPLWLSIVVVIMMMMMMAPCGRALICTRHPANTDTPKSPVDENYVISIIGNPETYILGQEYNVSLNAFNGHRYISFIMALEDENGTFNNDLGRFEVTDPIETRFSSSCINMVENTNTNPKTHMHLTWIAPSEPRSGCILIRATVLQHRDVWHMDDGGLTRRICQEVVDDLESLPSAATLDNPCCACDEARYELQFEGVWSRNLHPNHFPTRRWETRFCELVGAAHSSDYRFWEPGQLASDAVKQYAEHCTSILLDQEFAVNNRDQKIRTIIKARGPGYPNLNGRTTASIRVDPIHHLLSFASKIEPSPDWIVGVSGLELCLRNCTWVESKVVQLYPWDVGTDAGPTYTSPDQPQVPPDVIRRMRSDFPNDERSPFHDKDGMPMKPMATLTVQRQRIYERRCLDEDSNNDPEVPRECVTHPWSSWSECSTKCGEGMQYRRRVYKQPELAKITSCTVSLYEERACEGEACGAEGMRNPSNPYDFNEGLGGGMDMEMGMGRENGARLGLGMGRGRGMGPGMDLQQSSYSRRAECQVGGWSDWGPCSVTCGEGYQTRQRQYLNPGAEFKCQSAHNVNLQDTQRCSGRSCMGNLNGEFMGMDNRYGQRLPSEAETEDQETKFSSSGGSLNRYNQEQPTDDRNYGIGFEVGDLKGTNYGNQDTRTDSLWTPRQQSRLNKKPTYEIKEQFPNKYINYNYDQDAPRLEDAERAPYYRRPGDRSNQKLDNRYPDHRQTTGNSDYGDVSSKMETAQESWNRYTNTNNNNNYGRTYDETPNNADDLDPLLSKHCFQMLSTNPSCHNDTILGNYWFYNFCLDECMIFAVDSCDRNVNKFSRWESCQECRRPELRHLQQIATASQECETILASQRADQRFWKDERTRSPFIRRNNGNRARG